MTETLEILIDEVIKNSFKNFHTKGLDYICLHRDKNLTEKYYFFEGNLGSLPEIVVPHNHRYDFTTTVLSGTVRNRIYLEDNVGETYSKFNYYTPLNGGTGFTYMDEIKLSLSSDIPYYRNETYLSKAKEIHTLQIASDTAVAKLIQYEDLLPEETPTQAYRLGSKETPNLNGLYEKFTEDEVLKRLKQIEELSKC
jgi:hypothetical protein